MAKDYSESIATRLVLPPPFLIDPLPRVGGEGSAREFTELDRGGEEEVLADSLHHNYLGIPMVQALGLRLPKAGEKEWLLPLEPMITITGKQIIAKRQVAKGKSRGSIKERWTLDDYSVKIQGVLIEQGGERYPEEDVRQLRRYCEAGEVIASSPLLELFGISRLVIEQWELPHTSGIANQNYSLSCLSDDSYKLLLKR